MTGLDMTPWSTWTAERGVRVHVMCRRDAEVYVFPGGRRPGWDTLFGPQDSPADVAGALSLYHRMVGAPWQMTAGVSGCASVRAMWPSRAPGKAPYWGVGVGHRPYAAPLVAAGDVMWQRRLSVAERSMRFVHQWDLTAARLAAAGVALLAWNRPEPMGPIAFDPRLAGWWQVRRAEVPRTHPWAPPLVDPAHGSGELMWVSTPVMGEWQRFGRNPEVIDSVVAESRRWLFEWAKRIDAARKSTSGRLHIAVKQTYRETFGMWAREGGSIYSPTNAAQVIDRGRVTLIQKAQKINEASGAWPVKAVTDALWYTSDAEDPVVAAAELGVPIHPDNLGYFRHKSTTPIVEWLSAMEKGMVRA